MKYNLYEIAVHFTLKAKNQRTRVGSVFLGASSPNLGHGLFLKWIRLQRLFSRLLTQFFPSIGFK